VEGCFSFEPPFQKILEEGFDKGSAKDEMTPGGLEDLSGEELVGKIFHPLGAFLQFILFDDGRFFKDIFTVPAMGAGGLIAVSCLEMLDEAVEFPVVHLDEIPDFKIEDLPKLGDLQDVHVLRLDEILEMKRGKGPLSRKGKKVEDIPVKTPVFIGLDVFEEKRRPFEALRDFEMVITDIFVMGKVLGPYPWGFEELHRFRQFPIEAEVAGILEITVGFLLTLPRGMAVMVDVLKIIGTLPEADVIDDQLQVTLHRLPDGLQGFEFAVDVFIDNDLLHSHLLILDGLADRVDPGRGGDFDLQAGKSFSHEIDEVRNAYRHRICARFVDPFEKLDQLPITLSRVLEVSEAWGVEKVAELQAFLMAGLNIPIDITAVDLRQNKAGPSSSHDVKGKLPEERIDGRPLEGIDQGKIPI
jgi:hypothetical protein